MDINNDNHLVLDEMIKNFYVDKQQADHFKKMAEDFNSQIKKLLAQENLKEFETSNGLVAKMTIQKRESFNEPKLIEKLKSIDKSDAIDLVEVINWDKIEDMIYNGNLDASTLAEFKEVKEVATLKVSEKKGN